MRGPATALLSGWCLAAGMAWAGAVAGAGVPVTAVESACPEDAEFGRDGYVVRSAKLETPLGFLPWLATDVREANRLLAPLQGQPYSAKRLDEVSEAIERLRFASIDATKRVALRATGVVVLKCVGLELDLVFFVYSMQVAPFLGNTWEAARSEAARPEVQSGAAVAPGRVRAVPRLGYLAREGAGAGLQASYMAKDAANEGSLWQTANFDGYAARHAHDVMLSMDGSREFSDGWLANAKWRLGYADSLAPAAALELKHGQLGATVSALTRPLGSGALSLRFGGSYERGEYGSNALSPALAGAPDERYQALRLFVGSTARMKRQTFTGSYAVEVGDAKRSGDWVKQIVDLAHDVRWRVGDHRNLTLESHFTAGHVSESGIAPPGVRFYGGGRESEFLASDDWQIRSGPVLRGLGANALAGGAGNAGYRRFAAINLTVAVPAYRKPLVPVEIATDAEVRSALNAQFNSAVKFAEVENRDKDPHLKAARAMLDDVQGVLADLAAVVKGAQRAKPGLLPVEFKRCLGKLGIAKIEVAGAREAKEGAQFGSVIDLLPGDDSGDSLGNVLEACIDELNAELGDASLTSRGAQLKTLIDRMIQEIAAIDGDAAFRSARREYRPVRRIVNTLMDETNLHAVSPMLMLDVARLAPNSAGPVASRVGIGVGVRVTLVDSVDFSVGYMANRRRQGGEPAGAFSFVMQFKDPF